MNRAPNRRSVCQIFRHRSDGDSVCGEKLYGTGAPRKYSWVYSVPAATALGSPQIVKGNLRRLSDKSSVSGLPTPRKAEVHKALECLLNFLGCVDRCIDRHACGDDDFSLDTLLVLIRKFYAIQYNSRRPYGRGIAGWERPAHDLRYYRLFDFRDKFRMDVEIFKGGWHGLRLSKQFGVFQFVIAVLDSMNFLAPLGAHGQLMTD
jgi:hypothetical protein